MLSHTFNLGTFYARPSVVPQPKDGCLLIFPNYVTGFLMGVECAYASREQVEGLLKLAHAERHYNVPPPQAISEQVAAQMLRISPGTLRGWVARGWIYRWWEVQQGYVYSWAEVEALRLARPRSL